MLEDSEAASKFIDTIIDAKLNGVEMEPEVRTNLHRNLTERLEMQIITTLISQLNTQEQIEVEHLIDTNQETQIPEYLQKHDVDLNRILANVMANFQAAYLGA